MDTIETFEAVTKPVKSQNAAARPMRGRGLSVVVIGMMIVSGLGALPASAQPQEGDVVATGHIAAGEPLTGFWASLWYGYPTEFH